MNHVFPEVNKVGLQDHSNTLHHPIGDLSTEENLQAALDISVEKFSIPKRNSIRHSSVSEISTLSKQAKPNRLLGQHALSTIAANPNVPNSLFNTKQASYQRYENRRRNSTGDVHANTSNFDLQSFTNTNNSMPMNQRSRRMTWSQNSYIHQIHKTEEFDVPKVINSFKVLLQNRYSQIIQSKDIKENQEINDKLQLFELFQKLCPNKMPSLQYLTSFYNHHSDILIDEYDTTILEECIDSSKIHLISDSTKQRLLQYFQGKNYPADLKEWLSTRINEQSSAKICHRENHVKSALNFKIQKNTVSIVNEANPSDEIYTSSNNSISFMFSTRALGENYEDSNEYVSEIMQKLKSDIGSSTLEQKLIDLVANAAKSVKAYGMSSFGGIQISQETGRISIVSCGNIRVLVLRRSPITGMLYRVLELPIPSASSGIHNTLQNWPSYQEILGNQSGYSKDVLMQALMYHVAYTGHRDSSCFLMEQTIQSQEGDFVLVADQAFFDIVSGEEIRHLVSCTLSPNEEKDIVRFDEKYRDIPSMLNSIWLHRVSSIDSYLSTLQAKHNSLYQNHPKSAYAPLLHPTNLNIVSGWVTSISE